MTYRAYFSDRDGRFSLSETFSAFDDADAVWRACAIPQFPSTVEVWDAQRLVARLTTTGREPAASSLAEALG